MAMQSRYEPLTEREQEILALLHDDLSNQEIAQRLFLALSTVKWHLHNIYGKLGVQNRSEAVAHARQLGLLRPSLSGMEATHNLPASPTRFIGRTTELAELGGLLETPAIRLVTILAPGGMGKTRLALRCAEAQLPNYPDGVFYVPLSPLRSVQESALSMADVIAMAIANALSLTLYTAGSPQQQVLEYLRYKTILLVIDNCEHVLNGMSFLSDMLTHAPQVKILTTSRERLRLSGETVFHLRGLNFPGHPAPDAIQYPAVQLFVDTARRTHRAFEPDANAMEHMIRICRFVDGMPLGIELAAGWSHLLSVEEIAHEIAHDLDFLATDQADVPPRLRSARVVFNYAWTRLTDEEQAVFMRLSIFRGGFTRQAAQAVAGATLKTLSGLVDRSLLWRSSQQRYSIHELLRQYAHEHLQMSREMEPTLDAHSYYYLDFLSQREADIKGRRQLAGLDEIESDFENIRGAWEWALECEMYDALYPTAEALLWYGSMRGQLRAALDLFRQAEARIDPAQSQQTERLWARLMLRNVRLRILLKDPKDIREDLARCFKIVQEQTDPSEIACCLWLLGNIEDHIDDMPAARPYYEQSLELYQKLNDHFYVAQLSFHVARAYHDLGEPLEIARQYNHQSLALMRQIGNEIWIIWPLDNLGVISLLLGETAAATTYFREAYDTCRNLNNVLGTAWSAYRLSTPALWSDNLDPARRLAQEAVEIASAINHPATLGWAMTNLAYLDLIDGAYARSGQCFAEALPLAEYPATISHIYRGLGFVAYARGEFTVAKSHLANAIEFLPEPWRGVLSMVPAISLAAVIFAHQGETERAVEWLACVDSAANDTVRWLYKLSFIASLYDDLKTDFGPAAYAAARERGNQLELETVWAELRTEIANWN